MIATDRNGKLWFVAEGTLEPIGHDADPDGLTMAEEDFLFAQLPAPEKPDLGEDSFGFLYDQARDAEEERRCIAR